MTLKFSHKSRSLVLLFSLFDFVLSQFEGDVAKAEERIRKSVESTGKLVKNNISSIAIRGNIEWYLERENVNLLREISASKTKVTIHSELSRLDSSVPFCDVM